MIRAEFKRYKETIFSPFPPEKLSTLLEKLSTTQSFFIFWACTVLFAHSPRPRAVSAKHWRGLPPVAPPLQASLRPGSCGLSAAITHAKASPILHPRSGRPHHRSGCPRPEQPGCPGILQTTISFCQRITRISRKIMHETKRFLVRNRRTKNLKFVQSVQFIGKPYTGASRRLIYGISHSR